jgi:flagellar hook-basal body complex protein FliE
VSIPAIALAGTPGVTTPAGATTSTAATTSGGATSGTSFSEALTRLVDSVDDNASQANDAVAGMLNKTGDVHDAMIALQRAEMSLQLTVQIRNKIVQAYQDIMRMPV